MKNQPTFFKYFFANIQDYEKLAHFWQGFSVRIIHFPFP